MQPSVYDYNLPESFKNLFPNLAKAVTKKALSGKNYANVANLMSKGGTEFTSFAKHKKFAKGLLKFLESHKTIFLDLYADLVATTLRKPFYAETWLNGKGDLGPSCNGAYNVTLLSSFKKILCAKFRSMMSTDFKFLEKRL
jgi:hypothetical protein